MSDLLVVTSSPRGPESETARLTTAFVDGYRAARPRASIDLLDLWAEPLPVFGGDHTAAKMTVIGGASPAGREATAWDSITRLVARFARADAYVFGVPMWNHGVPWVLKHLIDTITQPGLTFGFDLDAGYQGLLQGKRAAAMYSSAIWPSFGDDFHSTYFEGWLRFVGVEEIHSVRLGSNLIDARVDDARVRAHVEATELGRRFALAGSFRAQADARRPPDDAPASVAAALRPTS